MELGKKVPFFLLGMEPKFGPLRKAETPQDKKIFSTFFLNKTR